MTSSGSLSGWCWLVISFSPSFGLRSFDPSSFPSPRRGRARVRGPKQRGCFMDLFGWIQLVLYLLILLLLTKPMGLYLFRVLDAEGKTFLDPVFKPVERFLYRLLGVDSKKEQDWRHYTLSMLLFSMVGLVVHLRDPPSPAPSPFEPPGVRAGSSGPCLQHGRQFHHEHQLAELRRRVDPVLLFPDGGPGLS